MKNNLIKNPDEKHDDNFDEKQIDKKPILLKKKKKDKKDKFSKKISIKKMAKNKNFLKNILDTKNQLRCLKMYIKLLTQTKKVNYELVDIINNASIDLKNDINTLATDDEISRKIDFRKIHMTRYDFTAHYFYKKPVF